MRITLITLLYLILMPFALFAENLEPKQPKQQGKQFIAAKSALNKGQIDLFFSIKDELKNHPLAPYLEYYYLRRNFEKIDPSIIQVYIDTYPKSPMADKLRRKRLIEFAKAEEWDAFLQGYNVTNNIEIQCYYLNALEQTNRIKEAYLQISSLWLTGRFRPNNCAPLFNRWLEQHPNRAKLLWSRFELALKKYNYKLANKLIEKMAPHKKDQANAIIRLYSNPYLITKSLFLKQNQSPEVISFGIARLARRNPYYAGKLYKKLEKKYTFNDNQRQRMIQSIALKLALRKKKSSTYWFGKLVGRTLDPVYQEWMIRAAIYHGDWPLVKKSIDALTKEQKKETKWKYWYARALKKLGDTTKALSLFKKISSERSYHGFLAALYVNEKIEMKNRKLKITEEEFEIIKAIPAFKRAKSLFKLNQKNEATLELRYLMKQSNKKQQYTITILVSTWGWPSQMLRLNRYTLPRDDLNLRFPLSYYNTVTNGAEKHHINPALIYAIIRKESYFMPKVNSHAGAIGLMQLMPQTAYRTSKQYKLKYKGKEDLLHGETNIKLGSAHLNKLLKQFKQHPVLVIAAYNAGRRAVNRWIPRGKNIPADIWIETVPFHETRKYIKHVIAYYIVYQYRLGQIPKLDNIMKNVR